MTDTPTETSVPEVAVEAAITAGEMTFNMLAEDPAITGHGHGVPSVFDRRIFRAALTAALPHLAPSDAERERVIEGLTEHLAKLFYAIFPYDGDPAFKDKPAWVERGNSKMQQLARSKAREFLQAVPDFDLLRTPAPLPHVDSGGVRMRMETTSENIARDILGGRFPERSEPQMRPDIASAWDAIAADSLLAGARRKLSANELKRIITHVDKFAGLRAPIEAAPAGVRVKAPKLGDGSATGPYAELIRDLSVAMGLFASASFDLGLENPARRKLLDGAIDAIWKAVQILSVIEAQP